MGPLSLRNVSSLLLIDAGLLSILWEEMARALKRCTINTSGQSRRIEE
jgi:hypothetical protein